MGQGKHSYYEVFERIIEICSDLRLSPSNLELEYVVGGSLLDALCFTVTQNYFLETLYPPNKSVGYPSFEEVEDLITQLITDPPAVTGSIESDDLKTFLRPDLYDLSVFQTQNGDLGIGPRQLMPVDQVCAFLGCRMPMILRPVNGVEYQVVGACYLHGVMTGEPFLGALPTNMRQVVYIHEGKRQYRYLSEETGPASLEDPRLEKLGIDVARAREFWKRDQNVIFESHAKLFKAAGEIYKTLS